MNLLLCCDQCLRRSSFNPWVVGYAVQAELLDKMGLACCGHFTVA